MGVVIYNGNICMASRLVTCHFAGDVPRSGLSSLKKRVDSLDSRVVLGLPGAM